MRLVVSKSASLILEGKTTEHNWKEKVNNLNESQKLQTLKKYYKWLFCSNEYFGSALVKSPNTYRYTSNTQNRNQYAHSHKEKHTHTHTGTRPTTHAHTRPNMALKDACGHCMRHARKFFQGHVNIPDAFGYKQASKLESGNSIWTQLCVAIQRCLSLPAYLCSRMAEWPLSVYLW